MSGSRRQLLRFRVRLLEIEPAIWRQIEVPKAYSFWDLHVAIQDAMGWLDCHLHEFSVPELDGDGVARIGIPDDECEADVMAGWEVPLADYFVAPGDAARYEYDFGDGWMHEVVLVGLDAMAKGQAYPRCTGGARACPPEDCGGVGGYYDLLDVLSQPAHEDHDAMVEWLGSVTGARSPYDTDSFDPAAVKFTNPKKRLQRMMEYGG